MLIKIIKGIFIVLLSCLLLVTGLMVFSGYTIVINASEVEPHEKIEYKVGDTIKPFEHLNFDDGKYAAWLVIDRSDMAELHSEIPHRTCLELKEVKILKEMQRTWSFIYTEGDIATVTSGFYLFRNDKLIFSSGIVVDNAKEGLQGEYGWIDPVNKNALTNTCKKFRPVYWPVVVL